MIERRLLRQIEKVAARSRQRRLLGAWIICWLTVSTLIGLLVLANRTSGWYLPYATSILGGSVAFAAIGAWWLAFRSWRDPRLVARKIEAAHPELETRLLAAIDQRADETGTRFGYLQTRVIEDTLKHAYRNSWLQAVPPSQLITFHCFNLITFVGMLLLLLSLPDLQKPFHRDAEAVARAEDVSAAGDYQIAIEPGDADIERGTSLLVMARFAGKVPPEATLHVTRDDGVTEQFAMSKSLEDPLFGARIPEVRGALSYKVEFSEQVTQPYQVTVFESPRLARADAQLRFPEYTSMEARLIEDVRTITAVEGTHLTLLCRLNKPVETAEFVDREGNQTSLKKSPNDERLYTAEFDLAASLRLELHLEDAEGRPNKQPPEFTINALPNKPPDLKLVQPSHDLEVSPLEEVELKANAWDDFGLSRMGISYMLAEKVEELVLAQAVTAKERTTAEYMLAMENLEAEPDHLVSYYFWAEDHGPDGAVRRVSSDMYFAEVRHFDEIFREGQQPPGGDAQQRQQGQQNEGGPSQELAELQKQIINGTWKVIRREIAGVPSEQFADDVGLLLESQTSALEQAEKLNEQVEDPATERLLLDVRRKMLDAVKQLSEAQSNSQIEALQPALLAEQGAYQAILRLRSREHEVTQGRQGGGGGGGGSNRSQRQLDQMQMRDNENRYETESAAQTQQEQQDGETRQVLNRLRELARRQGDLNERLKELQSALEEAETEAQQEELRRQLQRLREEQQRLLRDVDEVQDRMDQPKNQERMADQQQQLSETRENVRRASEALEEGRISTAVAAGTRAEREFEELRDEFRRRSSGRFQEEMREMRQQANELDAQQVQLSEQLQSIDDPNKNSRSLRDTDQSKEIEEDLAAQRERLEQLLAEMREMVQAAESSEPLLADGLYDAARDALQQNLPQRLEAAARSLSRGFVNDAQQQEQQARQAVRELSDGVERAAEHVLGDETEALRRAREEIERLRSELDEEITRAEGGSAQQSTERPESPLDELLNRASDQPPSAEGASGADEQGPNQSGQGGQEQSSGQGQEGQEGQEGERQQGQGQQGQGQQGQGQQGQGQQGQGQQGQQGRGGQAANRAGRSLRSLSGGGAGGDDGAVGGGMQRRDAAPLTGDDYLDWSDRLRDVEEMITDPELRAEAARIRDRARGIRRDVKRHSQPPNWGLVELEIVKPLAELQDRVVEELLRRNSPKSLVPIDRDPVPPRFSEQVRQYYESLGTSK